jgi:hypothetical protein
MIIFIKKNDNLLKKLFFIFYYFHVTIFSKALENTMNRLIILICILSLQACALSSKPIDYREVQNSRPKNRLLLGNDWNNIDVSYAERIKPIKKPTLGLVL